MSETDRSETTVDVLERTLVRRILRREYAPGVNLPSVRQLRAFVAVASSLNSSKASGCVAKRSTRPARTCAHFEWVPGRTMHACSRNSGRNCSAPTMRLGRFCAHVDIVVSATSIAVTMPPAAAMAVATDCNPGTSPCTSVLLMLNMACTLFGLTPVEAMAGVTRHAARARTGATACPTAASLGVSARPNAPRLRGGRL